MDLVSLLDPFTNQPIKNPVVARDGHVYEYSTLKTWFENNYFSPITGEEMSDQVLHCPVIDKLCGKETVLVGETRLRVPPEGVDEKFWNCVLFNKHRELRQMIEAQPGVDYIPLLKAAIKRLSNPYRAKNPENEMDYLPIYALLLKVKDCFDWVIDEGFTTKNKLLLFTAAMTFWKPRQDQYRTILSWDEATENENILYMREFLYLRTFDQLSDSFEENVKKFKWINVLKDDLIMPVLMEKYKVRSTWYLSEEANKRITEKYLKSKFGF
jgi:hypothetical protein